MQRKYYRYHDMAPSFGVPMHAQQNSKRLTAAENGEIIVPQPVQEQKTPSLTEKTSSITESIFKDGKLLGRFETDDIILLCLIFLLIQNSEELDWPLLLALGYIFLSDKDFKLF